MSERVISSEASHYDEPFEQSLRPQLLSQYIGQDKIKHNLAIFIEAARMRSEPEPQAGSYTDVSGSSTLSIVYYMARLVLVRRHLLQLLQMK